MTGLPVPLFGKGVVLEAWEASLGAELKGLLDPPQGSAV